VTEQLRKLVELYNDLGLVPRIAAIVGIALATTAAGFAAIVWLPADHFLPRPTPDSWWRKHWAMRWTLMGVKNVIGVIVFVLGAVMLVTPGPGLVFILLGLSLLDFPGKRALERRLVQRPSVMKFLNDLRANFGKPTFMIESPILKGSRPPRERAAAGDPPPPHEIESGTLKGSRTPREGAAAGDPPSPHTIEPE
jgi:hypothetical protein